MRKDGELVDTLPRFPRFGPVPRSEVDRQGLFGDTIMIMDGFRSGLMPALFFNQTTT